VNATKQTGEPEPRRQLRRALDLVHLDRPAGRHPPPSPPPAASFDTLLGVTPAQACRPLTTKKSNDDVSSSNLTSKLSFKSSRNTTYRIAIDGYAGSNGTTVLNITGPRRRRNEVVRPAPRGHQRAAAPVAFSETNRWRTTSPPQRLRTLKSPTSP